MIKIENLNYIYQPKTPNERQALFDINIEIPTGMVTAIIGHTGSGKSTLVQQLNMLLKPTSGRIYIDGVEITAQKADMTLLRKKVGMVFQYPEHQLFEETVYKDIAFGLKNQGVKEIDSCVKKAMQLVGLGMEYEEKSPFELSGGEKRRVAIAGVIAMEPSVLVMDEPAAGLDPKGRAEILLMLKRLHEKNPQMTIIFVSHSMEDVAKTADNVIVMNKGRIAMQGTVPQVYSRSEELCDMELNVPQITRVVQKLIKAGYPLDKNIYTVEAAVNEIVKLIGGKNA